MYLAVDLFNKQLWTASKGRSSILGFRNWLTSPYCKKAVCYVMLHIA